MMHVDCPEHPLAGRLTQNQYLNPRSDAMSSVSKIVVQMASAGTSLPFKRSSNAVAAGVVACLARAPRLDTRQLAAFALLTAALALVAVPALAQAVGGGAGAGGTGNITTFLQNLVNIVTGTAGKLLAVLAICFVGIGALMGALSLRAAGGVVMGVMLIFSAAWIVDQIVA
jgi:type IV secretory pathway VirB2 component (pilin)